MLFLVWAYFIVVLILCVYGAHRSSMVWRLVRHGYKDPATPKITSFPKVLVQVPLYNESRVAERILRSVAALSYPKQLLEIQVLDDSTDRTRDTVDDTVLCLQKQGVPIRVIRREERVDYKAGALSAGLKLSDAEFVAIFDADFLPSEDFLINTVPFFTNTNVAFVQARWGYLNREQSFLTRTQAVLIDGHFQVEHAARSQRAFFNFNGTAGVWRKAAIIDAGGWQGDTVTEDLDLSYRAFLNGWQAVYLRDLECKSELPASISAFKSQQYRWMKGAAQVSRKLLPRILRSEWTLRQKVEAFFHLTANYCYPLMVITALLIAPVAVIRSELFFAVGFLFELFIFLFTLGALFLFYGYSQQSQGRRIIVYDLLGAIILGVGIAAHCARATFAGLFYWSGEFVRTPKTGALVISGNAGSSRQECNFRQLIKHKKELFMFLYLVCGLVYLTTSFLWLTVPFVLLILTGYAVILYSAMSHSQASSYE